MKSGSVTPESVANNIATDREKSNIVMANFGIDIFENETSNPNYFVSPFRTSFSISDKAYFVKNESPRILKVDDFSNIIKETVGQIDILVCVNCFMQTLETGYKLRGCVEVMVAAQTTIPFYGIDYRKAFGFISKNINASNNIIAEKIIDHFPGKYLEDSIKATFKVYNSIDLKRICLSANTLSCYEDLAKKLGEIVTAIRNNEQELKQILTTARQHCYDVTTFEDLDIIDLTHFLLTLLKLVGPVNFSGLGKRILEYLSMRDSCMINLYNTNYSTRFSKANTLSSPCPQFVSIYCPQASGSQSDNSKKIMSKYKKMNPDFIKDANWDSLIKIYDEIQLINSSPAPPILPPVITNVELISNLES